MTKSSLFHPWVLKLDLTVVCGSQSELLWDTPGCPSFYHTHQTSLHPQLPGSAATLPSSQSLWLALGWGDSIFGSILGFCVPTASAEVESAELRVEGREGRSKGIDDWVHSRSLARGLFEEI